MSTLESTGSFTVSGEGGRLKVDVFGYENPRPQTVSDANWLKSRISLEVGGCVLRVDVALTTHDVKFFLDELERAISTFEGAASLATDEGLLTAQITVHKTGGAHVSGELRELGIASVRVGFEFDSDQTFLRRTVSDLKELQRACPIVESV